MDSVDPSERFDQLVADIGTEFPRFRIIKKSESRFQRLIHYGLVAITFGQMRSYMNGYYTTIGKTLYVTEWWEECDPDDKYITLCHELIHLRQFRRWTPPLMGILYLLIPLPMGLAYFRTRFEKEAYAETLRATAECHGIEAIRRESLRSRILDQFTSASYGWMWPFPEHMSRWFERECAKLEANPLFRGDAGEPPPDSPTKNESENLAESDSSSDDVSSQMPGASCEPDHV